MPITAQSADGVTHEFPDGTAPEVIDRVMKEYSQKLPPSQQPDFAMDALRGFTEPVRGVAQLARKLTPGPGATLPEGSQAKAEGVETQGKTPQGEPSEMTPGGLAGGIASGLLPMGAAGAVAKVLPEAIGPLARTVGAGAAGGAMQPVESGDFWRTKSEQVGEGMALGFGFSVAGKTLSAGTNAVTRWLGNKNPENMQDKAVAVIIDRINKAHKYGAPSAQDMLDLINTSKKPLTLADVGSKGVRSLAGRAARSPGSEGQALANQFLTQRDAQARLRLTADIAKHVFSGPSMYQTMEGLTIARKAASDPLYQQADALQNIWSPRLQEFLNDRTGTIQRGLNVGFRHEAREALAEGRPFDPTMMGVDLDAEGNVKIIRTPNMRVLDMAKRGMDAMIAEHRDPLTGKLDAEGRNINILRKAYVAALDAADTSGVYKKARETFSGFSASMDALTLGRSVFSNTPEENEALIKDLSPGDKQFVLVGMVDMMRERLLKAGFNADESKAVLKSPYMIAQIKPFFKSPQDFDSFVQAVTEERMMAEAKNEILRGSQTAERQQEDLAHPLLRSISAAKIIGRTVEGRFFSAVGEMWRLHRDLKAKPDPELDSELAKIMFAPDIGKTPIGMRLLAPPPKPPSLTPRTPTSDIVIPGLAAGAAGVEAPREGETIQ